MPESTRKDDPAQEQGSPSSPFLSRGGLWVLGQMLLLALIALLTPLQPIRDSSEGLPPIPFAFAAELPLKREEGGRA